MKITIDTDKKSVLVEKTLQVSNYPTADPAEILWIVAENLVPHPEMSGPVPFEETK